MSTPAPHRFLPMFDIDEQKPLRGSINSSSTNIVQQGLMDALLRLFDLVIELGRDQPPREITETDDLDVDPLARACHRQLIAIPDLVEPTTETDELKERLQTLQRLRARKPSRLLRDVESAATTVVMVVIGALRDAIEAGIGRSPHRTREIVEQVRASLQVVRLPEPDSEPLVQFGRLIRGLLEIRRRRNSLPARTVRFVEQQLTESALPLYDQALLALAAEQVTEKLRAELSDLEAFLHELAGRGVEFVRNLDATRAAIDERRAETLRASRQSRASVLLEIAGASESEILAGLSSRQQCQDLRELTGKLLLKWEGDLREQAAGWMPATAPLGALLTHLPSETIADSFQRIVEQSLGEGHTLYEMIERAGIASTARDLYERAEQLCHLRSRDIEPFNITPCAVTIIRLPPPVGPQDARIREELAEAFVQLGPCSLVQAPASERHVVSVMRAAIGWPIGIEGGNTGMLLEYARAHELGHIPHLVGIVNDSTEGSAIPAYLELAAILDT